MILSLSEENYIKTIYHLSINQDGGVSTNAIAQEVDTRPASVSDMLKKLSEKKIVSYRKYKGVQITSSGKKIALDVIRKHRLWEVFLVDKLGFSWDEVHDIAEQLEHIKSPLLINKLDKFLGHPTVDPHGDPIPNEKGEIKKLPQEALADLTIGQKGFVVKVSDGDPSLLKHLDKIGIKLSTRIEILDKVSFDHTTLIKIDARKEIYISGEIAKHIMLTVK